MTLCSKPATLKGLLMLFVICVIGSITTDLQAQVFTNIYVFPPQVNNNNYGGTNTEGAYPKSLILSGNTLYGVCSGGGAYGRGTVFSVHTDGTGFITLHTFLENINNDQFGNYIVQGGYNPVGSLLVSSNKLYGATQFGGTAGGGTVFSINTDGSNFNTIYNFSGINTNGQKNLDGMQPVGGLIISDGILYGSTAIGGTNAQGAVFAVSNDGSYFRNLHSFATGEGSLPNRLTLAGANLYGVCTLEGKFGGGTLFTLCTRACY